jgi:hypothetical protein
MKPRDDLLGVHPQLDEIERQHEQSFFAMRMHASFHCVPGLAFTGSRRSWLGEWRMICGRFIHASTLPP